MALGTGADEFKGHSPTAMVGLARWEQGHFFFFKFHFCLPRGTEPHVGLRERLNT